MGQAARWQQLTAHVPTLQVPLGDPAEHAGWSRRLRAVVARLADIDDTPLEPSEVVVDTAAARESGAPTLTRERYVFDGGPRGRLVGTLLAPQGTGRHPAVLVSPGRNATLDRVTGVEPPDYPDRNLAEQLAHNGFVTLTMDYSLDGGLDPQRLAGRDEATVLAHMFALYGRSLLGALVGDALAAVRWLAAHPRVSTARPGLLGHSLGGAVALHTALLDDGPPRPVCVASHLGSYPVLYGRLLTGHEAAALPGVLRYADLPDLFVALAPAPLQVQHGQFDPFLDPADAAAAGKLVRGGYAAAGAGDQVEILELPIGHGTAVDQAIEFFDRTLRNLTSPPVPIPPVRVHFDVTARREVLDRVDESLASGALTLGPHLRRLEQVADPWVGGPAIGVGSGSAALEVALRVLGVAGRTVLVPVNTFVATATAALRAGARVDVVDLEPDGLGLDPDALRERLDQHRDVAAVVVVHIAGIISPALRDILLECDTRGIPVVEDAAHALGSRLDGRPAGSFGRLAAFSLYPTKVATSGEGGLITAARPADRDLAVRLRDHGRTAPGSTRHDCVGGNWRMSEVQAAVGLAHLERFAAILTERERLAAWYDAHLDGLPKLRRHRRPAGVQSNVYKYVALLDEDVDRGQLKDRLRSRHGVALSGEVYDILLCDQPVFRETLAGRCYPQARRFAERHVCLPVFPQMTTEQQQRVVTALHSELS